MLKDVEEDDHSQFPNTTVFRSSITLAGLGCEKIPLCTIRFACGVLYVSDTGQTSNVTAQVKDTGQGYAFPYREKSSRLLCMWLGISSPIHRSELQFVVFICCGKL